MASASFSAGRVSVTRRQSFKRTAEAVISAHNAWNRAGSCNAIRLFYASDSRMERLVLMPIPHNLDYFDSGWPDSAIIKGPIDLKRNINDVPFAFTIGLLNCSYSSCKWPPYFVRCLVERNTFISRPTTVKAFSFNLFELAVVHDMGHYLNIYCIL